MKFIDYVLTRVEIASVAALLWYAALSIIEHKLASSGSFFNAFECALALTIIVDGFMMIVSRWIGADKDDK